MIKDAHRENTLKYKTQGITKIMNMDIWIIGILNQLSVRGSYTKIKFSKKWICYWQNPSFGIGPCCIPNAICLNMEFVFMEMWRFPQ